MTSSNLKHFPRYWPFVRGIHRSPVNSPHKGQWRGALMFSLICVWINGWVNNGEAGDLRRYRARYDVTVMWMIYRISPQWYWLTQLQLPFHIILDPLCLFGASIFPFNPLRAFVPVMVLLTKITTEYFVPFHVRSRGSHMPQASFSLVETHVSKNALICCIPNAW